MTYAPHLQLSFFATDFDAVAVPFELLLVDRIEQGCIENDRKFSEAARCRHDVEGTQDREEVVMHFT